jgi:alkanesulfonate monooxygenase SsuD/methylene tetrahydromethanopterin reductase-like flavin-dependent oxidoreductase (luciferase family)
VEAAVHAFVADDLAVAREAARAALGYWVGLPSYNRALASAGYEAEAAAIAAAFAVGDQSGLQAAISDRLIDEYCLVGTAARCRDQLSAWDETDVATVAVVAHPVQREETYVQGVCRSLAALAPS